MTRTGLAAEVPTLDICREMAAIPALAEAFKEWDVALVWERELQYHTEWEVKKNPHRESGYNTYRTKVPHQWTHEEFTWETIPAPTVREMQLYLDDKRESSAWIMAIDVAPFLRVRHDKFDMRGESACDPDALARACIEAAK